MSQAQQAVMLEPEVAGRILRNISSPTTQFVSPMNMRRCVEKLDSLPPLPVTAQRILELSVDENAGVDDLANIVELDPSLSAQVIRWARSPLYGYRGDVTSVHQAIARVLGYDLVLNLALGLAAIKPLSVTMEGPLGLRSYWRHAVYTASLVPRLAQHVDANVRPATGMAYLAGLLHNIGFLVFGELFPAEFAYLNRLVATNPDLPVTRLERFAFGIDHCELGAALMKSWDMPEEIQIVLVEHHNPYYHGPHDVLVKLVSVADSLLASMNLGDVHDPGVPIDLLDDLHIRGTDLDTIMENMRQSSDGLDTLAGQLTP